MVEVPPPNDKTTWEALWIGFSVFILGVGAAIRKVVLINDRRRTEELQRILSEHEKRNVALVDELRGDFKKLDDKVDDARERIANIEGHIKARSTELREEPTPFDHNLEVIPGGKPA